MSVKQFSYSFSYLLLLQKLRFINGLIHGDLIASRNSTRSL